MVEGRKVVLITGASRGMGAHFASRFAQQGLRVAINYWKSEQKAAALLKDILEKHGQGVAVAIRANVASRRDVKRMFEFVIGHWKHVDILINNAGLNLDRSFLEMADEEWTIVIETILTGTFLCSQEFAKRYAGETGNIINLGALTAVRGRKNGANYCAARAGILTLTKCLALELAPRIRVNCVTPGWINTDEVMERYQLNREENFQQAVAKIPMRRLGTPEDVFRMIEFLVNTSSYVTGHNFFVDGGYLFPGRE